MVENNGKSGQRSLDIQSHSGLCRRYHLRGSFFLLMVLSLLIWYYLNSDVNFWTTMHILYNTTYSKAASARTFFIQFSSQTNLTFVHGDGKTISTTELPRLKAAEECKETKSRYHVAYPCNYHYIINETKRCTKEKPFLVLMVPVAPHNREARDIIRRTWGSEKNVMNKVVSLFFMLGLSGPDIKKEKDQQQLLHNESQTHHDIVQSDFLDHYSNLTIKTMIIMEWVASHCQMASYAMKIDSDIFLNVNNLVSMLLQAPRENYITGLVAYGAMVIRDPHSKWYFPEDIFPQGSYPPYALGLGYIFSLDLPRKLVEAAKHIKANIYIEDVNVGLIMDYLGLSFTSQSDQGLFNVFPVPFNRCRYSKLIATTTNSLNELENDWLELQKPGPHC